MITGDAAYIKKINRSLILKEIIKEGMISRADLSKVTALTRATISSQVADLIEEGLILESHQEHNAVGRKPIMLSLNNQAGFALGIDIDYRQISFNLTDLLGGTVSSLSIGINTTDYQEICSLLIDQINKFISDYSGSRYGIVGIAIAIHGLVSKDEMIHFVPRFRWENINLKNDLQSEIGLPIFLENNANLSSLAERVFVHHDTDNLICATIRSGIGLGLIIDNDFFQGQNGFAGEIGHMIVVPNGRQCNCGNKGCWEKYASESSLFEHLAKTRKMEHLTYNHINQWIQENDQEVHETMEQFLYYLSIGLNNMITIYNPDILVLDSELLHMYPDSLAKIERNLNSSINHYRELTLSSIGKKSSVLGACALVIKNFLDVPMLNLSFEK